MQQTTVAIQTIIASFEGLKTDIFNSTDISIKGSIEIGEYVLEYQFKYNKFVSICGHCDFKELGLEYRMKEHITIGTLRDEDQEGLDRFH